MIGLVGILLKTVGYPLAHEIEPNIYLGSWESAMSIEFLEKHNIQHILNCSDNLPFPKVSGIRKARLAIHDDLSLFSTRSFQNQIPEAVYFIQQAVQQNQAILIHCRCGMQRSASVLAAYLIWRDGVDVDLAIHHISERRKIACLPSCNFKIPLEHWYHYIKQSYNSS